MKRLLKEPLVHFLLLGAVIFMVYTGMSQPGGDKPGTITITQGQIESLVTGFVRTWQRPPSSEELASLVGDRVQEEVYYREALALGLDKDDPIIRRRLRQKLEFVSEDIAAQAEPTDADLNAYLQAHADKFRIEPRFTFCQVYLSPQKHGDNLHRDAALILTHLIQAGDKADASALGDSILLETNFDAEPLGEVAKQFGEAFAEKLSGIQTGQWQGPVESGFGVHLVKISERTEGRLPALTEVRDAVRREWDNARRLESNEKTYQGLLKRYTVTIERQQLVAENKVATKDR